MMASAKVAPKGNFERRRAGCQQRPGRFSDPAWDAADDEALARQLEAELNAGELIGERTRAGDDPASLALAKQLEAELNEAPDVDMEADAALAAALAERPSNGMDESSDDASLALALKLEQDEKDQILQAERARAAAASNNRRAAGRVAGDELRQHLFSGDAPTIGEGIPMAPPPPPLPRGNMPSYANVVGDEASGSNLPSQSAGAITGTSALSQQGPSYRSLGGGGPQYRSLGTSSTMAPPPRPPRLLIDGANVAHACSGSFDSAAIVRCVDYFTMGSRRTANVMSKGPLLARHAVAVTLSASRWDENDPVLRQLREEGILSLTPTGKYDDLFLLQCADDSGAWVVTNDGWTEPAARRHASGRARVIKYAFVGRALCHAR